MATEDLTYAPAVVDNPTPAAWNPAPVIVGGVRQPDNRAEKPLTAADVTALIVKEVG